MSPNPHETPIPRRAVVWLVGVVVTGRVVDGPTEYELRQLSRTQIAASLVAFGASMALFGWVGVVMHSGVRTAVLTYAGMTVGIASLPFVLQACAARLLRYVEDASRRNTVTDPAGNDARTRP